MAPHALPFSKKMPLLRRAFSRKHQRQKRRPKGSFPSLSEEFHSRAASFPSHDGNAGMDPSITASTPRKRKKPTPAPLHTKVSGMLKNPLSWVSNEQVVKANQHQHQHHHSAFSRKRRKFEWPMTTCNKSSSSGDDDYDDMEIESDQVPLMGFMAEKSRNGEMISWYQRGSLATLATECSSHQSPVE